MQGADAAFWNAVDTGDPALLANSALAFGSARLVLADKTLLERSIRALSAYSGQPAPLVRAELAQEVRRFQPPGVLISEQMTRLLDTAARFVEKGGTLTVELKPDPPLGLDKLQRLMTPGFDLVDLLGVTASLVPPG